MSLGVLRIRVTTWDKPNYELFDGESDLYVEDTFEVSQSGYIYRNNTDNKTYMCDDYKGLLDTQLYKVLLNVSIQDDHFVIGSPKQLRHLGQDDLWIQLQGRPTTNTQLGFPDILECVQLKPNDVVKLGKKQFRVVQISHTDSLQLERSHYESFGSLLDSNFDSAILDTSALTTQTDNRKQCRICLSSSYSTTNPLMGVCKCSGSAKYIHYECLRRWLDGKMQIKYCPPYSVELNAKSVRCELCLGFYPPTFTVGCTTFKLYSVGDLQLAQHLILEDFDGSIIILNFKDVQQLTMGRGHESNIKISEITISRTHVKFFINDKRLYIQDQASKFGTLLKMQQPRQVQHREQLYLQSGRSRISIKHVGQRSRLSAMFNRCICQNEHAN